VAKADNTFDKLNRSVTRRCCVCWWTFRCPVEQMHREMCSACTSIAEAIIREESSLAVPPSP
jgi:hypothetical protein